MHASPGASTGLPPCSFDILRPDPQTLTLRHIASSPTRWTAIPAVPNADGNALPARVRASRREYYAPGHNASVDGLGAALRPPPPEAAGQHTFALPAALAGSAPLLEAHAGASAVQGGWQLNGRHRARPDLRSFAPSARPCSPPASSPSSGGRSDDAPHGVRDEHARKAARAQAEFEREVERRAPPRRRAAHAAAGPSSAPERGAGAADVDADARDRAFLAGVPAKRRKPSDANRKHICPRCSRAFNRPSSLRVHGHKHTGHRRMSLLPPAGPLASLTPHGSVHLPVPGVRAHIYRELEHASPPAHAFPCRPGGRRRVAANAGGGHEHHGFDWRRRVRLGF
jgi:hypothetical protein